jgi:hypothetical protein
MALLLMPGTLLLMATAVRKEWKLFSKLAVTLLIVQIVLTILQCALSVPWESFISNTPGNKEFMVRILCYGALGLLCLTSTTIVAVRCLFNFDKGLKIYLQQSSLPSGQYGKERIRRHATTDSQEVHMLPRRMELD